MKIEQESVNGMNHGHTSVGTTPTKLTSVKGFKALKGVLFRSPGSTDPTPNTVPIWIGGPGVTADSQDSGGMPLLPGDAMFLPIENLDSIYVITTTAGQEIAWLSI